MENKDLQNPEEENRETEILRNDEANPNDRTVVVDEEDRTVLLTEDETIIIEKEEGYTLAPQNRPRKPYAGMWGIPEIVTVGFAALTALILLLIYLLLVMPAGRELEQNRAKRDQLEQDLISANRKYGNITDTESRVRTLVGSVSDFESRFLKNETIGKAAIYQQLNTLIDAYGLVNTTGPDYVPIEISEQERQQGGEARAQRGRSKFQSLFPGVYVTTTVEGSYFNLRRFIRDIEASQEFIVISAIELEPAEETGRDDTNDTIEVTQENARGELVKMTKKAPPKGKTRGQVVSLRMELAVYFQREAAQKSLTALPETVEPLADSVGN